MNAWISWLVSAPKDYPYWFWPIALYAAWALFVWVLVASLEEINPRSWHFRFRNLLYPKRIEASFKSCEYAAEIILEPIGFVALGCIFTVVTVFFLLFQYPVYFLFTGRWVVLSPDESFALKGYPDKNNPAEVKTIIPFSPLLALVLSVVVLFWEFMGYRTWQPALRMTSSDGYITAGIFFGVPATITLVWASVKFRWFPRTKQVFQEAWLTANHKYCRKISIRQQST